MNQISFHRWKKSKQTRAMSKINSDEIKAERGHAWIGIQEYERCAPRGDSDLWSSICPDCGRSFKFLHRTGWFPKSPPRRCRLHEIPGKPVIFAPEDDEEDIVLTFAEYISQDRKPKFVKSIEYR